MLITSIRFQRITSYLAHINVSCSCLSIPQSVRFVGQIARVLCSLQNVFQMKPLALQAHLQAAREIAPHSPDLNSQSFTFGIIWRTECMKTTPRQLMIWRQQLQQDQGNPHREMCSCHWQFCLPFASVPAMPRGSFGTHSEENIQVRLSDLQTGSFVEWSCTNWS